MQNLQTYPEPVQDSLQHGTMTMEEFLENDVEGYEYVKGELVQMPSTSIKHGEICSNLCLLLGLHVRTHQLGQVYAFSTSFKLVDRVVKPDAAFLSTGRIPENKYIGSPVPPDLAIEVVSSEDLQYDVTEKALAYLKAGTRLVWVIEPIAKTVTVYRSDTDITLLNYEDTLTGEEVVEGFLCPVAELFE